MSVICSECQFQNQPDANLCRRCKFPFDGEWPSLISQTIGNYQLVRRVGGGGFGAVYHAKHVTLGNSFAVKILHPNLAKEEHFIERFQQEAYVLAELRHEHMLQVIDFGFLEGVGFYLITEWLEGRNLYRIWRRHPNLDRGWLLALFSQLLDALAYAHERGIVHRDLKPENLMLTKGARNRMLLKIVDFGIAKIVEQGANTVDSEERRSTMAVGTPYYMAPEQVQGLVDRIGMRTDLYACGIILAEMLTGQRVFEGNEQRETMRLHLEALPPSLSELNPEGTYSEELQQVVYRALAKDPDHRFENAQAFYEALQHSMTALDVEPVWEDIYQNAEPGSKPTPSRRERPPIEYRRLTPPKGSTSHLPGILLGLVFLLAMLGGGFFFLSTLETPPPEPRPPARRTKVIADGWGSFVKPRERKPSLVIPDIPASLDGGDEPGSIQPPTPVDRRTTRRRRRKATRRRATRRAPERRAPERRAPEQREPERRAPEQREPERRAPVVRRARTYKFSLKTNPPGGKVYVNGKFVGTTPMTIAGEKGQLLKIRAAMPDKVDYQVKWRVLGNKTYRHRFIEDL